VPNSNKILQFEKVLLNLGEAFDLKESAFIAPKSGIYEFNFDGHKTGDEQSLNISLRLNGKDAVNAWSNFMGFHQGLGFHDFRNLISMHSFLKLNKGDRIDLYNKQGNLYHGVDGLVVQQTQFTGKLLLGDSLSKPFPAVYFIAQKSVAHCDSESSVPFEIVNLNVGGAFNLKQKEFISPVAGIYEFTVKGSKTGNPEEMEISLRHNKKRVANAWVDYVGIHDFHTPFSITSILKIDKGDRVDLFLVKGCLYDDMNHYTHFTGKLLMEYVSNKTELRSPADAIYFNVQKNAPFSTANAVIPFEYGILNIGGAFNLNEYYKEHFFTAPRSGFYEFNVAGIKSTKMSDLRLALRLNSKPVAFAVAYFVSRHNFYTPFSLQCILKLKKGDRVDLFNVGQGSEIHDNIKRTTHFTGKLLLADNSMV